VNFFTIQQQRRSGENLNSPDAYDPTDAIYSESTKSIPRQDNLYWRNIQEIKIYMVFRYKALENAHEKWLLDEVKKNGAYAKEQKLAVI
jgi:hypothetical protein